MSLVYIEVFRSLPLLVLLIAFYYGFGEYIETLGISAFWIAIVCLSLNESAYLGDGYRGIISSLPIGQWRAAASLGLTKWQAYGRVILPQAIRASLPQTTNAVIYLLKSSSLASLITVQELVANAYLIIFRTFRPFEVLTIVLIVYVLLATVIAYIPRLVNYLQRKESR